LEEVETRVASAENIEVQAEIQELVLGRINDKPNLRKYAETSFPRTQAFDRKIGVNGYKKRGEG